MGLLGGSDYPQAGFEDGDQVKSGTTKRVVDEEAGVVLYAWMERNMAGGVALTAIPIDQTDLDPEDFE